MDREAIRRELIEIYNEDTGEEITELNDPQSLVEDLGLDSVGIVSLVMQVERKFKIRFEQEEMIEIQNIGQMLDLLKLKLEAIETATPETKAA